MAARPRTLPAAVAPVLVGTALAATEGTFQAFTFIAALIGALFIQVGTNLSNDYSDARRGADTEDRLGPVRVTAGGLVPPRQVLVATYVAFGLAVLAGSYLIAVAGWELLLIGVASILAGVLYTGGPRPYGYEGLGEVFVFLFFGVVAVTGSYFAQVERLEWEAFVLAVPVGLLASAILVVNNVRDLETDRRAGKRTLAVRLGRERTRVLYGAMVEVAFLSAPVPWLAGSDLSPWLLLPLLALPLARADRADRARRAPTGRRSTARSRARAAPARVLRPALGGPPGELMRLVRWRTALALREPLHAAWGTLTERELLLVRLDGDDGLGASARRRRWRATTASRSPRCGRRSTRTPRCSPGERDARRAARGLPGRARPAAGAGGGRPRAVGPGGQARRALGGAADLHRGRRARSRSTRRSPPRTAPAPRPRPRRRPRPTSTA